MSKAFEATRCGAFVEHCSNAELRSTTLSPALERSIQSLGHQSGANFKTLVEIVGKESPKLASEAACKATAIAEYIAEEAPMVFEKIEKAGVVSFHAIKASAPHVYSAAHSIGIVALREAEKFGPEMWHSVAIGGGTVAGFIGTQDPAALTEAFTQAGDSLKELANSAGGLFSGGVPLDQLKGIGDVVGNAGDHIGSLSGQAGDLGRIGQEVGGQAIDIGRDVGGQALGVGKELGGHLAGVSGDVGNMASGVAGGAATVGKDVAGHVAGFGKDIGDALGFGGGGGGGGGGASAAAAVSATGMSTGGGGGGSGGGGDGGGGGGGDFFREVGKAGGEIGKLGGEVGKLGNQAMNAVGDVNISGSLGAVGGAAGSAMKAIDNADILKHVGGAAGSAMKAIDNADILQHVGSALGTAGVAVANALDADTMAQVGNVALQVIGTSAAVFPFLLPLQIALRDLASAMQLANYNKNSAQLLADRCNDCGKLAAEMAPKITKITSNENEQIRMLEGITASITESKEFIQGFTKKGFLFKMASAIKDERSLKILDAKVSSSLQTLSIRINGAQMDLAAADSKKLDELFLLMSQGCPKGPTNPSDMNPEILAEIARKAGMETKEEISTEMQGMGLKLDEINKAINIVMVKVDIIDKKIDTIDTKLDEKFAESKARDEQMRQILLHNQAEAERRDKIALEMMMSLSGNKGVNRKFSNQEETERMGKRALSTIENWEKLPDKQVKLIHPHGIGKETIERIDGEHGQHGVNGLSPPHGRSGEDGQSAGQEGLDGDDGDDGDCGDDGHDGEPGENCPEYALMISLEKIHEDGCRTYKLEHSGQGEKDVHFLKIHPDKDLILVNARGGMGGNG